MDAQTIETYFKRHRTVTYMLLALSALIIFLMIFLSNQLATQQALTTASQASELTANQTATANFAGGQDGEQGGTGNTINSASSCPIKGEYFARYGAEPDESKCFQINFCDYASCGYKNVSYSCLRQVDSRGRQIRRNLGSSCRTDPIKDVAALCGCIMAPTTAPSSSPSVTVPVLPSPEVTVPPPSPSPTEVVACRATLTGYQGDRNYCLQEPGPSATVRYTKVKCEKNGVVTEKQLTCGAAGQQGTCCNLSSFTQENANTMCGCPN